MNHVSVIRIVICVVVLLTVQFNQTTAQNLSTKNHEVSVETATSLIKNYQDKPTVPNIKSGLFSRNIFDKILAQPGCKGIRYYYAKQSDSTHTLVVVGVDSNSVDIASGIIGETIWPCPPFCDTKSILNR